MSKDRVAPAAWDQTPPETRIHRAFFVSVLPGSAVCTAVEEKAAAPKRWPGTPWSISPDSPGARQQQGDHEHCGWARSHLNSWWLLQTLPKSLMFLQMRLFVAWGSSIVLPGCSLLRSPVRRLRLLPWLLRGGGCCSAAPVPATAAGFPGCLQARASCRSSAPGCRHLVRRGTAPPYTCVSH